MTRRRGTEDLERDRKRAEDDRYFKYHVEITISGLGILLIEAEKKERPEKANELTLFFPQMVGEHRTAHPQHVPHLPLLTYYAEDHLAVPVGRSLYTSPEGREVVRQSIESTYLTFEPDYFYQKYEEPEKTTLHWYGKHGSSPSDPVDDKYLDWLMDGSKLGISTVACGAAGTVVKFPPGELWARNVARNQQSIKVEPILWRTGEHKKQAVANEWVFRMQRLEGGLTLRLWDLDAKGCASAGDEREVIELLPGGRRQECEETPSKKKEPLLRLAITNQPIRFDGHESHLPMLAKLADVDPSKIFIPTPVNDYHCINVACDVPYVIKTGGK